MIVGIFFGLTAAIGQSISYLATRHYVQLRPKGASLQLLVLSHIWMGVLALILLPFIWPASGIHWSALLWPMVGETLTYICGQVCLVTALKHCEASRVSPLLTGKLFITATLASTLGQPVGAVSAGMTPLQWGAVLMCIIAGVSINFSGGRLKWKALLAIAAAATSFALSDYTINLLIKGLLMSPGVDKLHASLLTEAFCYVVTAGLAIPLLIPLGSRRAHDWKDSIPFSLAWFLAMVFLFLGFATVGVMLGTILQCTRGFITILIGAALMYAGHAHIEAAQPRGVMMRRLLAGLLMFAGITLYVIRAPKSPPLHKTAAAPTMQTIPAPVAIAAETGR